MNSFIFLIFGYNKNVKEYKSDELSIIRIFASLRARRIKDYGNIRDKGFTRFSQR